MGGAMYSGPGVEVGSGGSAGGGAGVLTWGASGMSPSGATNVSVVSTCGVSVVSVVSIAGSEIGSISGLTIALSTPWSSASISGDDCSMIGVGVFGAGLAIGLGCGLLATVIVAVLSIVGVGS